MKAGVDEAGRGPVLGPMVMAGVVCTDDQIKKLTEIGVKDSKLLSLKKRGELFEQVKEIVTAFEIIVLSPADIDAKDIRNMSLNDLEAEATITILKKIKASSAIIDCPSTNVVSYQNYLQEALPNMKIISEHKADLNYVQVGAASILAKVTRDRLIDEIKIRVGHDVGSGYPSDPKTRVFLQEYWKKYPDLFRKSWETYKKVASSKAQTGLGDFYR